MYNERVCGSWLRTAELFARSCNYNERGRSTRRALKKDRHTHFCLEIFYVKRELHTLTFISRRKIVHTIMYLAEWRRRVVARVM